MNKLLKSSMLGIGAAASLVAASTAADARPYHRYHRHHGGDDAAIALGAGIIGLGVGAAIASSSHDRYYDRGYYDRGYYGRGYGSYYDPYYGGGYGYGGYYDGYYARPYRGSWGYGYRHRARHCFTERRYDPYWGRSTRIRVCR
jgi:hypothetical protein